MGKAIEWIIKGIVGMVVVLALAWAAARVAGPGQAQREALALLGAPWQPEGGNAFGALWLLAHDVPPHEVATLVAVDAHRMRQAAGPGEDGTGGLDGFATEAAARFADQSPSSDDRALFCEPRGSDCLPRVRAELDAYQALVQRNASLLARIDRLAGDGYVANQLPSRIDAPFPDFGLLRLGVTRNAVLFAQGDVDAALQASCRDIDTWRRLGGNTDMLVVQMTSLAIAGDANAQLLAQMLHELPAHHPVPEICAVAVRPVHVEERSVCRAMRGELAFASGMVDMTRNALAEAANPVERLLSSLVYNAHKTRGEMALVYGQSCSAGERARIASDLPIRDAALPRHGWARPGCIDNLVGCLLAAIGSPAYDGYRHRAQDLGARMQVLGTLLWLREQGTGPRTLVERLATRPEALRSPARDIEVGADGRSLRIRQYDTSQGDYWEVPLPDDVVAPSVAD
ncbi:hypothetical protein E2F46_05880 [Luteimonas aestuarii]|uniref:Uncharacterized protein n=1 Tax=Luteimonas aestuarii TaxID=453837 RepID=A0A4R5TY49_9GAMM|nr:hypothetical protein [Luteimonas aestuarii]TDK26125.1 hypothetical protein E2F46_05880 [Luteimonas aestuarii]